MASNGINNDAYFIGSEEQVIEMKSAEQAFPSGNVPDPELHYAAVKDSSSNQPAAIFKFPDSLAQKHSEDVAPPIYQTLESGVDESIYQALGVDARIYQALNNNRKSPGDQWGKGNACLPITPRWSYCIRLLKTMHRRFQKRRYREQLSSPGSWPDNGDSKDIK